MLHTSDKLIIENCHKCEKEFRYELANNKRLRKYCDDCRQVKQRSGYMEGVVGAPEAEKKAEPKTIPLAETIEVMAVNDFFLGGLYIPKDTILKTRKENHNRVNIIIGDEIVNTQSHKWDAIIQSGDAKIIDDEINRRTKISIIRNRLKEIEQLLIDLEGGC